MAETFTGIPGKYVPLKETIRGFKTIIDGEMDEYPEAAFFNVGTIDDVIEKAKNGRLLLPAIDGEVQILTNHEECVVALKTGEVRIGTPKGEMIPAVCGSGFAEVTSDNQVEILVDTIERPEEIDIRRAKEAKSVQKNGYCSIRVGWNIIVIPHRWQERWHV